MSQARQPPHRGRRLRPPLSQAEDPDHHLWRNGRLWWVAFTVHLPGWQKERIRLSLGTADPAEARRRRDELLRRYPESRGCDLSLRFVPRRARRTPAMAAA
jgi:hypothetical protein